MKHIILLQKAHDLIRGSQIHTPEGLTTPNADNLAHEINMYLNNQQTHASGCWTWGPGHYMCAYHRIKALEKELSTLSD